MLNIQVSVFYLSSYCAYNSLGLRSGKTYILLHPLNAMSSKCYLFKFLLKY